MFKLCLNPSFWGSVTWEHAFHEDIELCRAVQCKTITWLRLGASLPCVVRQTLDNFLTENPTSVQ